MSAPDKCSNIEGATEAYNVSFRLRSKFQFSGLAFARGMPSNSRLDSESVSHFSTLLEHGVAMPYIFALASSAGEDGLHGML